MIPTSGVAGMLFARLLDHLITAGTLRVHTPDHSYVFTGSPGPSATMRLHDHSVGRKLFLNPRLYLGEAYMNGTLTVEDCTLYDLLDLLIINIERAPIHPLRPFY